MEIENNNDDGTLIQTLRGHNNINCIAIFNNNKYIFLKSLLYLYFVSLFPKFIKNFFKKK